MSDIFSRIIYFGFRESIQFIAKLLSSSSSPKKNERNSTISSIEHRNWQIPRRLQKCPVLFQLHTESDVLINFEVLSFSLNGKWLSSIHMSNLERRTCTLQLHMPKSATSHHQRAVIAHNNNFILAKITSICVGVRSHNGALYTECHCQEFYGRCWWCARQII